MKKALKICAVILSLILIVGGIVLVTSAEDTVYSTGFTYIDKTTEQEVYTATDFGAAITNAKKNSVIKMHGDTVCEVNTGVDQDGNGIPIAKRTDAHGSLTIDLGGYTLTVVQHYKAQTIGISSQNKITVKNGTIRVMWPEKSAETPTAFPLFRLQQSNAQIEFYNVNTYVNTLVQAYSLAEDVKVTINGGNHYAIYATQDSIGGFVESRTPMIFTAKNANFYIGAKGSLISSLSYKAYSKDAETGDITQLLDPASTFDFINCNIVSESITGNIVKRSNEHTTITFTNSKIFGSLGSKYWVNSVGYLGVRLDDYDAEYGIAAAKEGSIRLGPGTVYARYVDIDENRTYAIYPEGVAIEGYSETVTSNAVASLVEGKTVELSAEEIAEEALTLTLNLPEMSFGVVTDEDGKLISYDTTFSTTATPKTYNFTHEERVPLFEYYDASEETTTTYYYGEADLAELINDTATGARDGDIVTFLYDYAIYPEGDEVIATIMSDLTIDLNGYIFSVYQLRLPNSSGILRGESKFDISGEGKTFTLKNGTIGVKHLGANSSYPIFVGRSGKTVNITLEDVRSFSGGLVYFYNAPGSTARITRGEHHVLYTPTGGIGGLVGSVSTGVNVTVDGSDIYVKQGGRLFGSATRHGNAENPNTTFTVRNSNIIGASASQILVEYANEFTSMAFESCNIIGSINPSYRAFFDDVVDSPASPFAGHMGDPKQHSITFDSNTYFLSGATMKDGVVSPNVGRFVDSTKSVTLTSHHLAGDPVFYTFSGTPETQTFTFDKGISDDRFEVTTAAGAVIYIRDQYIEDQYIPASIQEAYEEAKEGGTVKLLGNYVADGKYSDGRYDNPNNLSGANYGFIDITGAITIDLDGRTLEIRQGYHQTGGKDVIYVRTNSPVVIRNGIINAQMYDAATNTAKNQATYSIYSGQSAFDITLDNVSTNGGGLFYTYGGSGKLTVNGGDHNAAFKSGNSWGTAYIEAHKNFEFTANNANFYLESGTRLIAGITNQTGVSNIDFNFVGCNIVSTDEGNLFDYVNEFTHLSFENCNIVAGLERPATNHQYEKNGVIADGAITFGAGVKHLGERTEGLIVAETGSILEVISSDQVLEMYPLKYIGADIVTYGYVPSKELITKTFTYGTTEGVIVDIFEDIISGATSSETITITPGQPIPLPTIDTSVSDASSGWYVISYTGRWVDANGNVVESFVASGDSMKFYPEVTVTPKLTAARYNLTLMGHVGLFFYLPSTLPEGVTLTNVVHGDKAVDSSGTDSFYEENNAIIYKKYSIASIGIADTAKDVVITVNYTVSSEGNQQNELTQTITFSPIGYAAQVLAISDTESPYYPARRVCADLVRYAYYSMINSNRLSATYNYAKVEQLYSQYQSVCTPVDEAYFLKETDADAETSLEKYIEWVSFQVYDYQPRYRVKFKADAKVVAAAFTIEEGWQQKENLAVGGVNWIKDIAYYINSAWGSSYWTTEGEHAYRGNICDDNWSGSTAAKGENKYLAIVCPDNVPAYNINKTMIITITLEDGTEVSGTYDLPTYYQYLVGQEANGANYTNEKNVLLALDAYGRSAAAYRFGPAKDENGYVSGAR